MVNCEMRRKIQTNLDSYCDREQQSAKSVFLTLLLSHTAVCVCVFLCKGAECLQNQHKIASAAMCACNFKMHRIFSFFSFC